MRAHTCAGGWLDRRELLVLVALIAVSVTLGVLASSFDTFPLDDRLTAFARELGPSFKPIAGVPNEGNGIIALSAVAVGAAVLFIRRQPEALAMLLTVGALYLVTLFICLPAMAASLRRARLLTLQAQKSGTVSRELEETLADSGALVFGTLMILLVALIAALAIVKPY